MERPPRPVFGLRVNLVKRKIKTCFVIVTVRSPLEKIGLQVPDSTAGAPEDNAHFKRCGCR